MKVSYVHHDSVIFDLWSSRQTDQSSIKALTGVWQIFDRSQRAPGRFCENKVIDSDM